MGRFCELPPNKGAGTIATKTRTRKQTAVTPRPLVLLADESDGQGSSLEQHLEFQGYEVVRAAHRALALKFGRELHPDLVVIEATGSKTEGFGLARELQRRGPFSPPVLLLVAEVDEEALRTARAGGAILDCALAPVDLEEIMARVPTSLRSAHAARKRSFLRVPENAEHGGDDEMLCTLNLVDILAGFLEPRLTKSA